MRSKITPPGNKMPQVAIARLEDLRRQQSIKFKFRREGISRDGFAALFQGEIIVYENICRHLPLSIDYGDNRFFTGDGKQIICKTHGAVYEPLTGLCTAGPCQGASLFKIAFEVRDEKIWIETED
jgi:nitrite reductase/ring-hydroxylating ferredoxin subunit